MRKPAGRPVQRRGAPAGTIPTAEGVRASQRPALAAGHHRIDARGHNAAATLDSVAAYARIVAKEVLLGKGDSVKNLTLSGDRFLSKAQTEIAQDGPGKDLLYRAINGFSLAERRALTPTPPDIPMLPDVSPHDT